MSLESLLSRMATIGKDLPVRLGSGLCHSCFRSNLSYTPNPLFLHIPGHFYPGAAH